MKTKNRLDPIDVANSINTIVDKKSISTKQNQYFDKDGIEHLSLIDDQCCAMKILNNSLITYKIKMTKKNRFYDPSLNSSKYGLNKKDFPTQDAMFKFRETNEKAFNLYIKYLQKKYQSFLVEAERVA